MSFGLFFTASGAAHAPGQPWRDPLDRREWIVRPIPHRDALALITEHHYAGGGPRTSAAALGLYHRGGSDLLGAALWVPPVIGAAKHLRPEAPHSVLGLSRLALAPECPKNAASYLISACLPHLPDRYQTLLTYADEAAGHVGGIYQATNWDYAGATIATPVWRVGDRQVSNKRGQRTLSRADLLAEGAVMVGRSRKHRYVLRRGVPMRQHPTYPKAAA